MNIPSLFKKQYKEKDFQKKILSKLYIPADKTYIQGLFEKKSDPAKKTEYYSLKTNVFSADKKLQKAEEKRLKKIAKEIKAQKGRLQLINLLAALVLTVAIILALTVFRNQIARYLVVNGLEGLVGARVDIEEIDVNLLDAKFTLDGLEIANREQPMKNILEASRIELYFDLLELSRGKVKAKNLEARGISWGTDRSVSGALPPKKEKKYTAKQQEKEKSGETNPVSTAITKATSGISIDKGITAVMDQLNPVTILENEKKALQSPVVLDKITATVPSLTEKWEGKNAEVTTLTQKAVTDGKAVTAINPANLKTVEEVQAALTLVQSAGSTIKTAVSEAESTKNGITADLTTVNALVKEAETALKADTARIKNLADSIKGFNLDTGSKLFSGVFTSFVSTTLGDLYPTFQKGLSLLSGLKEKKAAEKTVSLKKKSSAIERAPGTLVHFGPYRSPRVHVENALVSVEDPLSRFSGSVSAIDITNEQSLLGKPTSFSGEIAHGSMSERFTGTVDLRDAADKTIQSTIQAQGYALNLPSGGAVAVPSLNGTLTVDGTFMVFKDGSITFNGKMTVNQLKTVIEPFEPAFVFAEYKTALSGITRVELDLGAVISADGNVDLTVDSPIDEQITKALQDSLSRQVAAVKEGVRKEGDKLIAEQKAKLTSYTARFKSVSDTANKTREQIRAYEKTADAKKAELEKRLKEIAAAKAAPVKKAATDAANKAVPDGIKKLF